MKTIRLLVVLVVVVVLAAVMAGPVLAQSNTAVLNSFGGGYRGYSGYSGGYSGYSGYSAPVVVAPMGPTVPLAILGGAAAAVLGGGPAYIVGGAALGWLFGDSLEAQAAQAPREQAEWYSDSSGNRWYRVWGSQWRIVPPQTTPPTAGPWVGPPPPSAPQPDP